MHLILFITMICIFFMSILIVMHSTSQIERHWTMNSTPELTLEKLQLIATSNVAPIHKVKWIKLFNSSVATREASRFPAKPANEEKLGNFLVRACWWAGVCVC